MHVRPAAQPRHLPLRIVAGRLLRATRGLLQSDLAPQVREQREGVAELLERLGDMLTAKASVQEFVLPVSDGRRIAWLHAHGEILSEEDAGEGGGESEGGPMRKFVVRLNPKELGQFETL